VSLLPLPGPSGCSRFEGLILSHHSRYKVTCECDEEEINDADDDDDDDDARAMKRILMMMMMAGPSPT